LGDSKIRKVALSKKYISKKILNQIELQYALHTPTYDRGSNKSFFEMLEQTKSGLGQYKMVPVTQEEEEISMASSS